MHHFHIHSVHDGPQNVDKEWLSKVLGKDVCSDCYSPLKREKPLNIQIGQKLEDVPLNVVMPVAIGLIRLDLLSALNDEEFHKYFLVGNAFDINGKRIDDFFTFLGKLQIVIHGGPSSSRRICETCKRQLYHPIGNRYILTSSLDGRPFYESQFSQIVATETAANRIASETCDRLKISQLPVFSRAKDE